MKPRHGAISSTLLTVAGVLGLSAAGLSVVTGVTPCSLMESCDSGVEAAPTAITVSGACESKAETVAASECSTKKECSDAETVTLVSDTEGDCSKASSCEGKAVAVAAKSSDCAAKTECSDAEAVTLVAASDADCSAAKSDCTSKAVAVNASECSTKSDCSDAKAVAVNAADADCSKAAACEGEAVAVNASDCASKADCGSTAVAVADSGECATAKACSGEAKAVNASDSDCSKASSCEGKAVAVNASECASKSECSDAKAVAVNASDCSTKSDCAEGESLTLVNAADAGDCEKSCAGEAKAVAVSDDSACQAECVEGDVKTVPVAVHAFNTECPYSGNAVKADVVASYNGMKVNFCCNGCKGRFDKADDAKKLTLVSGVVKPINDTCCGKPSKAETMAVVQGFPVAFCKSACGEMVAKAPAEKQAAFVASHIKPVNAECCGTSTEDAKMVGFHAGKAVALCGEKCAEYFNKASAEKKDAWMAKMVG